MCGIWEGIPRAMATNAPVSGGCLEGGSFIRADHKDKERIYDYGVRYVVDLRSRMECESRPDALIRMAGCSVLCSIPMLDQINSSDFRGQIPDSMGELYISLLRTPVLSFGGYAADS